SEQGRLSGNQMAAAKGQRTVLERGDLGHEGEVSAPEGCRRGAITRGDLREEVNRPGTPPARAFVELIRRARRGRGDRRQGQRGALELMDASRVDLPRRDRVGIVEQAAANQ